MSDMLCNKGTLVQFRTLYFSYVCIVFPLVIATKNLRYIAWQVIHFFFFSLLLSLVLRIWDVLLFEGNRVMLFRTALALMELYGIGTALIFAK